MDDRTQNQCSLNFSRSKNTICYRGGSLIRWRWELLLPLNRATNVISSVQNSALQISIPNPLLSTPRSRRGCTTRKRERRRERSSPAIRQCCLAGHSRKGERLRVGREMGLRAHALPKPQAEFSWRHGLGLNLLVVPKPNRKPNQIICSNHVSPIQHTPSHSPLCPNQTSLAAKSSQTKSQLFPQTGFNPFKNQA
jgi:hypothetical protein